MRYLLKWGIVGACLMLSIGAADAFGQFPFVQGWGARRWAYSAGAPGLYYAGAPGGWRAGYYSAGAPATYYVPTVSGTFAAGAAGCGCSGGTAGYSVGAPSQYYVPMISGTFAAGASSGGCTGGSSGATDQTLQSMNATLTNMNTTLTNMNTTLTNIKDSLTRIESEVKKQRSTPLPPAPKAGGEQSRGRIGPPPRGETAEAQLARATEHNRIATAELQGFLGQIKPEPSTKDALAAIRPKYAQGEMGVAAGPKKSSRQLNSRRGVSRSY